MAVTDPIGFARRAQARLEELHRTVAARIAEQFVIDLAGLDPEADAELIARATDEALRGITAGALALSEEHGFGRSPLAEHLAGVAVDAFLDRWLALQAANPRNTIGAA